MMFTLTNPLTLPRLIELPEFLGTCQQCLCVGWINPDKLICSACLWQEREEEVKDELA